MFIGNGNETEKKIINMKSQKMSMAISKHR